MPFAQSDLSATLRDKAVVLRRRVAQLGVSEGSALLAQAEEFEALARAVEVQERTMPIPKLGPVKWGTPWRLSK